jgi:hypothetical protein
MQMPQRNIGGKRLWLEFRAYRLAFARMTT